MATLVAWYVTIGCIFCLVVALYMLQKYANSEVLWDAKLTVFFGWFFSYSIVLLLPMELSDTDDQVRDQLYAIFASIYWISFFLTWAIIPIQQMVCLSGYFTKRDQVVDSLKVNGKFYLVAALLYIALLIYVSFLKGVEAASVPAMAMGMANLWGLLLSILLLGYGLVEVPRKLWRSSNVGTRMNYLLYKTATAHEQLGDARDTLDETLALYKRANQLGRDKFPKEFEDMKNTIPQAELTRRVGRDNVSDDSFYDRLNQEIKLSTLAYIHARLKFEITDLRRLERYYDDSLRKAFSQEQKSSVSPVACSGFWNMVLKATAGFLAVFSVLLIWSELVLVFDPNLSPFYAISRSARHDPGCILFGFFGFCYMSYCALFALFRLKLSVYYSMHKEQGTDANSILFNASYTLRLIFPLGYNFLQVFDWELRNQTALGKLLGPLEDVKILDSANNILPILILVLTVATASNFYNKMLRKFGFSTFLYSGNNDIETAQQIKEGSLLLAKAKREDRRGLSERKLRGDNLIDRIRTLGSRFIGRGHQRLVEDGIRLEDKTNNNGYNLSDVREE